MSDHYQVMTIVAGAIRSCRSETTGGKVSSDISTEELNGMAKAIITALAESGLRIVSADKDGMQNKTSAV